MSRMKTRCLLLLLASALPMGGGCIFSVELVEIGSAPFFPAAAPLMPATTVALFAQRHGPRVTLENHTAETLEVRYWVGRVDVTARDGVGDLRTRDDLFFHLPPGTASMAQCGRRGWVTGYTDSILRVSITPVRLAEPGQDRAPEPLGPARWYELEQPQPYDLRVSADEEGAMHVERLAREGVQVGGLRQLSPDQHIARANGPHPVYDRRTPAAQ